MVRTVVAASIGAVFEWYDLLIYAMFVPTLSKLFFPTADPAVGVLLSLSTFASAWLVRHVLTYLDPQRSGANRRS